MATDLSRRAFLRTGSRVAAGAAALAALPAAFSSEAEASSVMVGGVPQYDMRGRSERSVQAGAAAASNNAIAIVCYGGPEDVEEAARQAARELIGRGWPVGIILADGDGAMQIYVNGQPMAINHRVPADSDGIRDEVVAAFTRYQEAAQLAANPDPQ